MSSSATKYGFACLLLGDDMDAGELWQIIVAFLEKAQLSELHYSINPGMGKRRRFRDSLTLLSADEIREELGLDNVNTFYVSGSKSPFQSVMYNPTPLDGGLQRLHIGVVPFDGHNPDWSPLVESLSQHKINILCFSFNQHYNGWQNCLERDTYLRKYGSIDGFKQFERGSDPYIVHCLDTSLNPGRGSQDGLLPRRAESEMWLGPSFWEFAPCTKEEVLAADFFTEKRDTPHFLYLKSWPHPFTRPDGEQGRVQQKLWRLLFHEDCEWPPGSGAISDMPIGGPPELMPNSSQE